MKYFVLVLLVAVIAVQARVPENLPEFERGLRHIIEKLKHGNTKLPLRLPSLRPLKVPSNTITYRSFTMDLSESTVQGLENLQVDWVRASVPESDLLDLAVSLAVSVPTTVVSRAVDYHLTGSVLGIPIDNRGELEATIDNFKGVANVKLVRRGSSTAVANLDLQFSADVEVQLSGANVIINRAVNSVLTGLLSDSDSEIFAKAKEIITNMVNEYLRTYTPGQLTRLVEKEG